MAGVGRSSSPLLPRRDRGGCEGETSAAPPEHSVSSVLTGTAADGVAPTWRARFLYSATVSRDSEPVGWCGAGSLFLVAPARRTAVVPKIGSVSPPL